MNIKKSFKFCLKLLCGGVLAVVILSLLCLVYYNPPLAVAQPDGYTNFKFTPNAHWRAMTEGNGGGVTNSLGYIGLRDFKAGEKSICFLGSSHTEALQVDTEENFVSRLESMLHSDEPADNDYQCLNLGVSAHSFEVVASNFQSFANNFGQTDYVVIETQNIEFSEETLVKMLNEEYHSDLEQHSFAYKALQRVPYMRLLVKQMKDLRKNGAAAPSEPAEARSFENYGELLQPVLQKLSEISNEHQFKTVILHHCPIAFDADNRAYAQFNAECTEAFRQVCEQNGIVYLNTNDVFCAHADANMELPYGFPNTRFGTGHLNEVGHRLIAELLYSELFSAKEV